MRQFLGYCEFSNGWVAIDVDEGHGWLVACFFAFFQGKKTLEIESVEGWGLCIFSKVDKCDTDSATKI